MTKQITLEKALELVSFYQGLDGIWYVDNVKGKITGDVFDDIEGTVHGDVTGDVCGSIWGDVGRVDGRINSREWQYVETPKEKLKRLIEEGADKEQLLEAFNQLEDS